MATVSEFMADGKPLAEAEKEAPGILMQLYHDALQLAAKSEVMSDGKALAVAEAEAPGILMELHYEDMRIGAAPVLKPLPKSRKRKLSSE